MLDALVSANRWMEDDALLRIGGRFADGCRANADGFSRNEDALGIETMQDHAEAVALRADAVSLRHFEAIDEQHVRVGRMAAQLADGAYFDMLAVEISIEKAQAIGLALDLLIGRGAR